jgi:hypothetical protein
MSLPLLLLLAPSGGAMPDGMTEGMSQSHAALDTVSAAC